MKCPMCHNEENNMRKLKINGLKCRFCGYLASEKKRSKGDTNSSQQS